MSALVDALQKGQVTGDCTLAAVLDGPEVGSRMLLRRSAKGRVYYGCEGYPQCDFMTWDEPVPQQCEKCGATLFKKGSRLYCAKEGCDFETQVAK